MAGIAAMMRSRKERQKKRHDSKLSLQAETELGGEVVPGRDGSQAAAAAAGAALSEKANPSDKSPSSLKKFGAGGDQKMTAASKKKDGESISMGKTKEQRLIEHIMTESYTPVYLGLVFISLGMVITFVGLGDKGFRTTELRLIGPSLCFFGLCCIIYKILQCHFPRMFVTPYWLKRARLADSNPDTTNLIERGLVKSIHVGTSAVVAGTPAIGLSPTSPRVILQSVPQVVRPKSSATVPTIPNYIDDSSDDDFDSGVRRSRPPPPTSRTTRPLAHHESIRSNDDHEKKPSEIILDPKTLKV